MNNTVKRLILFFGALPLLTAVILLMPWYGHLGLIVIMSAGGLFCGIEMRAMLYRSAPPLPRYSVIIPALTPLLAWGMNMGWLPSQTPVYALLLGVFWAFLAPVFAGPGSIPAGFTRIASRMTLIIYPSFFLWWTARITWFDNAPIYMLIFMFMVYLNDAAAWLFGTLFGKHRDIVPVSPGKSIEGFAGGILTTVGVVIAASCLFPGVMPSSWLTRIVFGLIAGAAVIAGDLVESAIKRAVGVKDSGSIILGRGGMLDSVDSIIFAAPVFVLFMEQASL